MLSVFAWEGDDTSQLERKQWGSKEASRLGLSWQLQGRLGQGTWASFVCLNWAQKFGENGPRTWAIKGPNTMINKNKKK